MNTKMSLKFMKCVQSKKAFRIIVELDFFQFGKVFEPKCDFQILEPSLLTESNAIYWELNFLVDKTP